MKNVYIFGDSHTDPILRAMRQFKELNPIEAVSWPCTMSNIGRRKLELIDIKRKCVYDNYNIDNGHNIIIHDVNLNDLIKDGDIICFCFGEIDCRAHLCKPQNLKTQKELIDIIVDKYFDTIRLNVEQFNNLEVIVCCVVPATRTSGTNLFESYSPGPFPFYGTDEERKSAGLYVNLKLKEYCIKYNHIFLDIYDKYCDDNGFLNPTMKDHQVHIKENVYIVEFLNNLINQEKWN